MSEDLINILNRIKNIDVELLKREGRDYEFTDIFPFIKRTFESILELEKAEDWVSSLPPERLQDLINQLKSFTDTIDKINSFTPTQLPNPQGERDNLSTTIRNLYNSLYEKLIEPMKLDVVSRRSVKSRLTTLSKQAEEEVIEIKKIKKNVEDLLDATKKTTVQVGFATFSEVFESEAEERRKSSLKWFWASAIIFIILIIYLLCITQESIKIISVNSMKIDSLQILTLFLAKFFPATVGYYILYQMIKNFNVNMHLYTTNKHRSNVLKTFESFVKSSDDPKTRDAVLMKAAESIFTIGDTGYLSGKDTEKDGLNLVQIIDSLRKT